MHSRLTVPVDHGQFLVEDADAADLSDWDLGATYEQLGRDHLATAPGGLVVATACSYGPVPIEVETRLAPSDEPLDGWDHAAEAGLVVRSGRIALFGPEGSKDPDRASVAVPPGTYRVLVLYGNLDSVPDLDSREGREHYRVVLWPATDTGVIVHKRGFWCCRAGRHGAC